jgi:4-diphosphocytidyl-2-C-methyl-D-erythritol kinase
LELLYGTREICLTCNNSTIPLDEKNLIYKAAKLLQDSYNVDKGVSFHIQKNIPVGAGLGGGSSNAAAVISELSNLWEISLTGAQQSNIGAKLGMDIPFCIRGGTILAEGRGEILKKEYPTPALSLVVVYPNLLVSTPKVYQTLDTLPSYSPVSSVPLLEAIEQQQFNNIPNNLFNRLETATFHLYPQLKEIKGLLLSYGCEGVLMSGSGSSFFGICIDMEQAAFIAQQITINTGFWTEATYTIPAYGPAIITPYKDAINS